MNMGWICPKCGRVYAPTIVQCFICSEPPKVTCGSNSMPPLPIERPTSADAPYERFPIVTCKRDINETKGTTACE
jgi:hypothetical protein